LLERGVCVVEEKVKPRMRHTVMMENRNKLEMTGITDVISFDLNKVLLETDYGVITLKGSNLHVSRLTVEKGELDIDGEITAMEYSKAFDMDRKGESLLGRLLK
jgi:sporulation protein YabP